MARWFVLWLALLCVALAACSKPVDQGDIRMGLAQAPLNLDPRYASDAASARVNRLLYRPLVDFDAQSRPTPALASWQLLGPRHYRFTLKPQPAPFNDDGSLPTAQDVAATYRSLLALKASPLSAEFANIAAIEVIDDRTLDFRLHAPDENFPARLIIGILPARLIAKDHDFARHPVGSGPLAFVSWRAQAAPRQRRPALRAR